MLKVKSYPLVKWVEAMASTVMSSLAVSSWVRGCPPGYKSYILLWGLMWYHCSLCFVEKLPYSGHEPPDFIKVEACHHEHCELKESGEMALVTVCVSYFGMCQNLDSNCSHVRWVVAWLRRQHMFNRSLRRIWPWSSFHSIENFSRMRCL